MRTIKGAIRESIAKRNPLTTDQVIKDVLSEFPEASTKAIRVEALRILREGPWTKTRIGRTRRFEWNQDKSQLVQRRVVRYKPETPEKEMPDKLNMVELGHAITDYVQSLEKKIQEMAGACASAEGKARDQNTLIEKLRLSVENEVKQKHALQTKLDRQAEEYEKTNRELNQRVTVLNRRVQSLEKSASAVDAGAKRTFPMSDVVRFRMNNKGAAQ